MNVRVIGAALAAPEAALSLSLSLSLSSVVVFSPVFFWEVTINPFLGNFEKSSLVLKSNTTWSQLGLVNSSQEIAFFELRLAKWLHTSPQTSSEPWSSEDQKVKVILGLLGHSSTSRRHRIKRNFLHKVPLKWKVNRNLCFATFA